jgi:hypothetical protein
MKRIFVVILVLSAGFSASGEVDMIKKGENALQMMHIAAVVQFLGARDLVDQIDYSSDQAETAVSQLAWWMRYLALLGGVEYNGEAISDVTSSADDDWFRAAAAAQAADNHLEVPRNPLRRLPLAKSLISTLSDSLGILKESVPLQNAADDTALELLLRTSRLIENGKLEEAEQLLSVLERNTSQWDTITIPIAGGELVDVYFYDPLLFAVTAELWFMFAEVQLSKKNGSDLVGQYYQSQLDFFRGNYDTALNRLEIILRQVESPIIRQWFLTVQAAAEKEAAPVLTYAEQTDSDAVSANLAMQIAWYTDYYDLADNLISNVNERSLLREYQPRVTGLTLMGKGQYYQSWLAFGDFAESLRRSDITRPVELSWKLLYVRVRFENGYNDRGAGSEILELLNGLDTGWASAWAFRQLFAQYYIYHIGAKSS